MLKRILIAMIFLGSLLSVPLVLQSSTVSAATEANCRGESDNFLKFPTWYKYLKPTFTEGTDAKPAECKIIFDITKDVGKILLAVVEILLRVAGLVAVGFVIYGGIQFILSEGKPDKYGKARDVTVNAAIGLAIAASATVIVNLIGNALVK